jgi:hypothetical protein
MNTYHIQSFGLLADRRGLSQETIRNAADTPAGLYQELRRNHPMGLSQNDLRAVVNDGHRGSGLEYQVYPALALATGKRILEEEVSRHGVVNAICRCRVP